MVGVRYWLTQGAGTAKGRKRAMCEFELWQPFLTEFEGVAPAISVNAWRRIQSQLIRNGVWNENADFVWEMMEPRGELMNAGSFLMLFEGALDFGVRTLDQGVLTMPHPGMGDVYILSESIPVWVLARTHEMRIERFLRLE